MPRRYRKSKRESKEHRRNQYSRKKTNKLKELKKRAVGFYPRSIYRNEELLTNRPEYRKLKRDVEREINFYSGMVMESNGRQVLHNHTKRFIQEFNHITREQTNPYTCDDFDFEANNVCNCEYCIETFGYTEPAFEPIPIENLAEKLEEDFSKWEYRY